MSTPLPATNEASRLEHLRRYEILDTPPEQIFDELAKLASIVCHTPFSLINFGFYSRNGGKPHITSLRTSV